MGWARPFTDRIFRLNCISISDVKGRFMGVAKDLFFNLPMDQHTKPIRSSEKHYISYLCVYVTALNRITFMAFLRICYVIRWLLDLNNNNNTHFKVNFFFFSKNETYMFDV